MDYGLRIMTTMFSQLPTTSTACLVRVFVNKGRLPTFFSRRHAHVAFKIAYREEEFLMPQTATHCRPIVLSGPSGGGKSTILSKAMATYSNSFAFSVSHTTRQPRDGERNGVHYWFTTKEKIQEMIARDEFLESATFGGNIYGTSRKAVEDVEKTGKICVLDLELQGVRSIKKAGIDAKFILIKAPSLKVLEERLRLRGTETEETLAKRLKHAKEDAEAVEADPTLFDLIIINDDLERAYAEFLDSIRDELDFTQQRNNEMRA